MATTAVGLFLLARMPALAERIRPTARRRQGLPEDVDLQDPEDLVGLIEPKPGVIEPVVDDVEEPAVE